ncbi:glycosyltransferase family 2 protein [Hafnia paralvei]|uniref:glycosyltransferase family 2 protein n=1 Tax=Hafnia paralvei TaxID=546367 RepID=UPI0024B8A730|nr:glycosyltransferase family 2 protein [Hafnia paralvei]
MTVGDKSIDIVMATYNGALYVEEQLRSIIKMDGFEKYINKIIICDDRSTDKTIDIVMRTVPEEYLVILYNNEKYPFGPCKNFERGISYSKSDYVLLSDQDDFWESNKLLKLLSCVQSDNKAVPQLVFSDLKVVDKNLEVINSSFFDYQSIKLEWSHSLKNLLIQNIAPGCSMLINRTLINEAMPFPINCLMHDWWLILVCKLKGEVYSCQEPLVLYRQHGNNQVGAKSNSFLSLILSFKKNLDSSSYNLRKTIEQMTDFAKKFQSILSVDEKHYIHIWGECTNKNTSRLNRVRLAFKYRLRKSSLVKTLGLYLIIILGKK